MPEHAAPAPTRATAAPATRCSILSKFTRRAATFLLRGAAKLNVLDSPGSDPDPTDSSTIAGPTPGATPMPRRAPLILTTTALLLSSTTLAQSPAPKPQPRPTNTQQSTAAPNLSSHIHTRTTAILRALQDKGLTEEQLVSIVADASAVFDTAIAWSRPQDARALAEAAWVFNFAFLTGYASPEARGTAIPALAAAPDAARAISMLIAKGDDPKAALDVLAALLAAEPKKVAAYPSLAAAIALVYDRPHHTRPMSREDPGERIDPVEVFRYFTGAESRLLYSPRTTPAQLLTYMVDTSATIDELSWALGRHAGDRNVGQRYNDVVYDTAQFKGRAPAKLKGKPYTLQNIRKIGGICVDQAYYAAHVARAIGVPAVMVVGEQADVGHAWVGFLQDRADRTWNFDSGKHEEYEDVRGTAIDPQTGREVSEGELLMLGEACRARDDARAAAIAFVAAVDRLETRGNKTVWPPARPTGVDPASMRQTPVPATIAGRLQLLECAAENVRSLPSLWWALSRCSASLTIAQRDTWFRRLQSQAGDLAPDFTFDIASALITAVNDPDQQSRAWEWAFGQYPRRPDIAASCRLRQGAGWEKAGDKDRAFQAYQFVIERYPNDGKAIVDALAAAEKLLRAGGRADAVLGLYEDAFRRISKPKNMGGQFLLGSNYYRVGGRYAQILAAEGRQRDAEQVRSRLQRFLQEN